MIHAGASPKTLQRVLGHRIAAFGLTIYGYLFDADLDALAERLDLTGAKSGAAGTSETAVSSQP